MTTVLALDTCDRSSGAAVAVDGQVRACHVEIAPFRHSVRLLDLLESVLTGAGVTRQDLTLIAVSNGPGSFTGVRVGVSTAKALAFSLGIPAVGVSSLAALAHSCQPFPGVIVPVLDARKQQVYACAIDGCSGEVLLRENAWDAEQLVQALRDINRLCLFCGSGLTAYGEYFLEHLDNHYLSPHPTRHNINPGDIALLATRRFQEGQAVAPSALAPRYCRRSEAEEARLRSKAL